MQIQSMSSPCECCISPSWALQNHDSLLGYRDCNWNMKNRLTLTQGSNKGVASIVRLFTFLQIIEYNKNPSI